MKISQNILTSLILFTLPFVLSTIVNAQEQTPGQLIVATIDKGIKILKDPSLQDIDQFTERKNKLWGEINPIFDFEETSRRSLGHHWKARTPEERIRFTDVFIGILRDIYLDKSDSYAGEKIEYVREIVKGRRGKVRTYFHTADLKKVEVDFSMHQVKSEWKIYDVTIEGVSLVGNYRSQFKSILAENSFDHLMEKLIEKRENFSE